jgi:hypothetical protein
MTKEEFRAKFDEIKKQETALRVKMDKLKNDYIQSNKQFNIGDKVKVTSGKTGAVQFGILRKYYISMEDDVIPIIAKIKKNGEIHPNQNINYHFWAKDVIEPCND